jgi:hypothetical protein
MKMTITIGEEDYVVETPIEYPDADQLMYGIESVINKLGYPEKDIEVYILEWAKEIKLNRDGKG